MHLFFEEERFCVEFGSDYFPKVWHFETRDDSIYFNIYTGTGGGLQLQILLGTLMF